MRHSNICLVIALALSASMLQGALPAPALAQLPSSDALDGDVRGLGPADDELPDQDLPDTDLPDGDLPDRDLPGGNPPDGDLPAGEEP